MKSFYVLALFLNLSCTEAIHNSRVIKPTDTEESTKGGLIGSIREKIDKYREEGGKGIPRSKGDEPSGD
jgi:hypothetical protein